MISQTASALHGGAKLMEPGTLGQLRLAWRLLRDGRVTVLKFALPALLALYVLSPIDPVPDFLVGIGQVDDVGVVIAVALLMARILPKIAPESVVTEHLRSMGNSRGTDDTSPAGEVIDARFSVHR